MSDVLANIEPRTNEKTAQYQYEDDTTHATSTELQYTEKSIIDIEVQKNWKRIAYVCFEVA